MKTVGIFILKSVGFSVLLWMVGIAMFYSMNSFYQHSSVASGTNDNTAMMEKYWEQADETDSLQQETKAQLDLSTDILRKQAELLGRWEKVIEKWEQQSPK